MKTAPALLCWTVVSAFAAVPLAAVAPYPATAVLDAVKSACSRLERREDTVADLAASGWVTATLPEGSPLAELLAMGRTAGAAVLKADGGTMDTPAVYTKTVAGEDLTIILSSVSIEGMTVSGCRMYDVGETRPLSVAQATRWLGREPARNEANDALSIATWRPGLVDGQDSFDIYFVPATSPLIDVLKISGVAIRADRVGRAR